MPSTTLPLETFRSQFSLSPYHFWQQADGAIIPVDANCSDLVYEYAYQSGVNNAVGRSDIRNAINAATLKMQEHLGFSPVPHFASPALINPSPDAQSIPRFYDATQYRSNYVGADSRWLTLQLPEGKVRQIGVEKFTLVATANALGSILLQTGGNVLLETGGLILLEGTLSSSGATLAYTDSDGDGLIDLATIQFTPAALLDVDALECYFNDRNGEQPSNAWKIEPIKALQDSITLLVTITARAWQCVPPQAYDQVIPAALDPTTSAIYAPAIDVYLHTCDPTGTTTDDCQAVLIWETTPYPGWATVCFNCDLNFNNSRDPAAVAYAIARVGVRDAQAGIVYFGEAIYNTTSQQWLSQPMSNCRPPDRILIRYYAGDSLSNWQKTLANLSAAELGKRVCACSSANEMIYQQQIDRADNSSSKIDQFNLSQDDLGNPLGSKTGQIYAWKQIRHLRHIGGVRLP